MNIPGRKLPTDFGNQLKMRQNQNEVMNVLLLGSGGREHVIAWKLGQSKLLNKLYISPGNAGTAQIGTNINIAITDFPTLRKFVLQNQINMVVVGPEESLVKGIHDFFLADNELCRIPVIGPVQKGAILEGSKDFAKKFMNRYQIPTAAYKTFTKNSLDEGIRFLHNTNAPYVLKADGLAAGKGVVICQSVEEATVELQSMLQGAKFGEASEKVVVEEFLKGIELSVFVLTDGKTYRILPEAKDYKKIGEGDTGPNTGGMGSVSPVSFAGNDFMHKVENTIIRPTMNGLISEGIDFRGFVFFGLIKVENDPFVIEYNCRMGDPEAESVIPRIGNDLLELFIAVGQQKLETISIHVDPRHAATVMLVSKGYPDTYKKEKEISLPSQVVDSFVFHAGTKLDTKTGKLLTDGGRVMGVTSLGNSMKEALSKSYTNAGKIDFEGKYYRKDIGFDL
jgi:phosphoribosylamine---glycine ligase